MFKFCAGFIGGEVPVCFCVMLVSVVLPCGDFVDEGWPASKGRCEKWGSLELASNEQCQNNQGAVNMRERLKNVVLVLAVFLGIAVSQDANAQLIASVEGQAALQTNGFWRYTYTVTVDPDSTKIVDAFALTVSGDANLTPGSKPEFWTTAYAPGDTSITWSTFDPFDYSPIGPGSIGSFEFDSLVAPGEGFFTIYGVDDLGEFPALLEGSIVSPGVTPFLSHQLLLGSSLAGFAGVAAFIRWWFFV